MQIVGSDGLIPLLPSCLRAAGELALARLHHRSISPGGIVRLNELASTSACAGDPAGQVRGSQALFIQRVAFVIPRVAARLPWRADCLVQAMAAQRWLKSRGVPAQISIGVDHDADGSLLAHAWLKHGETIVTGGEISRFSPLLSAEAKQ